MGAWGRQRWKWGTPRKLLQEAWREDGCARDQTAVVTSGWFLFSCVKRHFSIRVKVIVSEWIWVVGQQELREASCEASEPDTHPPFQSPRCR